MQSDPEDSVTRPRRPSRWALFPLYAAVGAVIGGLTSDMDYPNALYVAVAIGLAVGLAILAVARFTGYLGRRP